MTAPIWLRIGYGGFAPASWRWICGDLAPHPTRRRRKQRRDPAFPQYHHEKTLSLAAHRGGLATAPRHAEVESEQKNQAKAPS